MKQIRQFVGWDTTVDVSFYENALFQNELTALTFGQGTEVFFQVTWAESFSDDFPLNYFVEKCTVSDQDSTDSRHRDLVNFYFKTH